MHVFNFEVLKKMVSAITVLSLVLSVVAVPLGTLAAAPGYTMGVVSATVTGALQLSISGSASAVPFVGQENSQFVTFVWGDGTEDSYAVQTDSHFTTTFTAKDFSTSWTPISHIYSTSGTKSIIVKVHHRNYSGNEGNASQFTADVFVPPAVVNVIKNVVNGGGGTKTASDFTLTASGSSVSPSSFSGSSVGTTVSLMAGAYSITETDPMGYSVTYSADCAGNISSGETKICTVTNTFESIADSTAPIVTISPDTQTIEALSSSGAPASFTVSAVDETDGNISGSASCDHASGSVFPLGSTTVTCSATDAAGNTCTDTAVVIVEDTTSPSIALVGSPTIDLNVSGTYSEPGATANDSVDGDLTSEIIISGSVNTTTPGIYVLTYTVTDAAGNSANVTRTVTVSDASAPDFGDIDDVNVPAEGSTTVVNFTLPLATDDVDDPITGICTPPSGSAFSVGTTTVSCEATDSNGNTGYGSFLVIVTDDSAPVIFFIGDSSVIVTKGATYTDAGATASDNVDGDLTSEIITVNPVDTDTIGVYFVTYNVSDSSGNAASSVTRSVEVVAPEVVTYTITASAGSNGSISPSGLVTVTEDNDQAFTITANGGFEVENVLVDGVSAGAVTSYSFSAVSVNHEISASFKSTGGGGGGGEEPENSAPVASPGTLSVTANTSGTVTLVATDADSDPIAYSISSLPSSGTVSLSNNLATYTPNSGFTGSDQFSFVASDGTATSSPAVISIMVNAVPVTPPSNPPSGGGGGGGGNGSPYTFGYVPPILGGGSVVPTGEVLGASITAEELAACLKEPYLKTYLKMGSNNDPVEVLKLQTFLNETMGSTIPLTGYFGPITFGAVKKFQTSYKEEVLIPWVKARAASDDSPSGYVYKTTKRWINIMKCRDLEPITPMPQLP